MNAADIVGWTDSRDCWCANCGLSLGAEAMRVIAYGRRAVKQSPLEPIHAGDEFNAYPICAMCCRYLPGIQITGTVRS